MHSRKQHKDRSVKLSGRCSICEWNKPAHSIQAIGLPISNQYNRSSRAWSSAEIKTVAWLKTSPFLINCRCDDWPPSTCTCGPWTTRWRYDHDRIPPRHNNDRWRSIPIRHGTDMLFLFLVALESPYSMPHRPPVQHFPPVTVNFDLWPWSLNCQDKPACQISRSKVT